MRWPSACARCTPPRWAHPGGRRNDLARAVPRGRGAHDRHGRLITARIEAAVATCRRVHDDVDDADPTSADLLHQIIQKEEQFAWMVSADTAGRRRARATDRAGQSFLSTVSSSFLIAFSTVAWSYCPARLSPEISAQRCTFVKSR